ncbi:MAG: LysR family transcriptional regulator [Pseudomonadota bacterium]
MEDLKRMAIFSAVVDAKSFSEAARRLGIAKSAISKHVSLLEQHLGVRLLNRTTRRLSLTEAGEKFYQSCARIVNEANEATREARRLQEQAVGTLKLSSTIAFGSKHLAPVISQFHEKHPELKIDLLLDDYVINIIEEGIDLSIRIGWLPESNLVARKLFMSPRIVVATPEYLKKHGRPQTPTELVNHNWIVVTLLPSPQRCTFKRNGQQQTVHVMSTTRTNSIGASLALVKNGDGITAVSSYLIEEDIKAGRLVPLLTKYETDEVGIFAVYPDRHHVPAKVRLFIDALNDYCDELTGYMR